MGLFGVSLELWSRDTDSEISIVEHPFDVGAIVPVHQHTREDEYSIALEGEMGFRSGDCEAVFGPGGNITKPRRETHTMWNAGTGARRGDLVFRQQQRHPVHRSGGVPRQDQTARAPD
ncbi:cupin domain-containing protein [Amycolatopsis carbonis]|uniref:Cupin domain-containing protein n=1 Tax=Amycolatopsis carbonis TaxID=715471 RepID=A0A9Y2IR75_9PSEU|nr:cupin domain-containing protein [Amycolatopsis sp. 2-15]WIX83691.1 cupin domain-containing protein [Amycolatopsis sp. 2-15]